MELETRSLLEFGISESLQVLNLGFSDYLVPIQLDLNRFSTMIRGDGIDLNASKVVIKDQEAVGVGLIARRGWSSRLAGMAVIPEARSMGVGKWLIKNLIDESKERGEQRMELEVIVANEPAVKLYEGFRFQKIRRLVSFSITPQPQQLSTSLKEVDILEIAHLVGLYGLPRLPWQIGAENLACAGPPQRGYRLADAYAVISPPEIEQITLRSLIVKPESRENGQGRDILKALFAQFPQKIWHVPAIFPEEMGVFFQKLGFEKQDLAQYQMELIF